MGLYIQDDKNCTVRHYYTTPKIEKAIETLLKAEVFYSETIEGYKVCIIDERGERADDE